MITYKHLGDYRSHFLIGIFGQVYRTVLRKELVKSSVPKRGR